MKNYKLLESYRTGGLDLKTDKTLDQISSELKQKLVDFISEKFLNKYLTDQSTIKRLNENLLRKIKNEYNTITLPYFYILESINLCVEVEMSDKQTEFINGQKFGEKKFSQLLNEGGFERPEPIKKFAISEKEFSNEISKFIEGYTSNFEVSDDSIKIEIL
jgi:hypothetical protein